MIDINQKLNFMKIYKENITREGSTELLNWLENTDFFRAPASTRYHGACEGGLVTHSISVYNVLINRFFEKNIDEKETFAICGLLHDVCKINFYKLSMRNVKNEITGSWEKQSYYSVDDTFPYGHGEKSVFLIERFMKLKSVEAISIRWHMGGFDDSVRTGGFSISQSYYKYPLAVKLHSADLESSYLHEKNTSDMMRR
ncbi:MAG: HD family phosphohydrolase [Candidatus Paraimprobicoccus trichonymphae]|uniref:HD family phosphohydrolase n=1 Tax=Candidatus Paraimprobicoccus trichonymphae TaxID=3033793 RepID=A0AA48KZQ7_9FIRM|nr:MAG: HD family phosphohydrolase [Candidatus Paraimprobicoccus trichonymphae]